VREKYCWLVADKPSEQAVTKLVRKLRFKEKTGMILKKKKEKETGMDFQIRAGRLVVWIFFFR
jgi:hypothetical protein